MNPPAELQARIDSLPWASESEAKKWPRGCTVLFLCKGCISYIGYHRPDWVGDRKIQAKGTFLLLKLPRVLFHSP